MGSNGILAVAAAALLASAGSAAAGPNLVTNGDFSAGNSGFTTGYALSTMTPQLFENNVHGIYAVEPAGSIAGSSAYGDWTNITTDPSGHNSNVWVADGATDPNVTVWSETVGVAANTTYTFSFFGAEVSNPCCSNATLQASINGVDESTLGTTGAWQQDSFTWNSGSNTSAVLTLVDTNTSGGFNDFAIDDLSFSGPGGVPEPGAWGLMLVGVGLAGAALRGRRSVALA
jgi:hypothetical protein